VPLAAAPQLEKYVLGMKCEIRSYFFTHAEVIIRLLLTLDRLSEPCFSALRSLARIAVLLLMLKNGCPDKVRPICSLVLRICY